MINHPIPNGTKVIAEYTSCETCGPIHIQKVSTRIREVKKRDDGNYDYTLLDGRVVPWSRIIEVML